MACELPCGDGVLERIFCINGTWIGQGTPIEESRLRDIEKYCENKTKPSKICPPLHGNWNCSLNGVPVVDKSSKSENGVQCTLECVDEDMIVFEQIVCINGTWIDDSGQGTPIEESKLRDIEETCENKTANGCGLLFGENFKSICTLNGHIVNGDTIFSLDLHKRTSCSLRCLDWKRTEVIVVECIGNNMWRKLGAMGSPPMDGYQVEQYTKICPPPEPTCQAFDIWRQSGEWECRSENDVIVGIVDDNQIQSNTKCDLKCEGEIHRSLGIKCEDGAWKVKSLVSLKQIFINIIFFEGNISRG